MCTRNTVQYIRYRRGGKGGGGGGARRPALAGGAPAPSPPPSALHGCILGGAESTPGSVPAGAPGSGGAGGGVRLAEPHGRAAAPGNGGAGGGPRCGAPPGNGGAGGGLRCSAEPGNGGAGGGARRPAVPGSGGGGGGTPWRPGAFGTGACASEAGIGSYRTPVVGTLTLAAGCSGGVTGDAAGAACGAAPATASLRFFCFAFSLRSCTPSLSFSTIFAQLLQSRVSPRHNIDEQGERTVVCKHHRWDRPIP